LLGERQTSAELRLRFIDDLEIVVEEMNQAAFRVIWNGAPMFPLAQTRRFEAER
jgi:hypothetical protein